MTTAPDYYDEQINTVPYYLFLAAEIKDLHSHNSIRLDLLLILHILLLFSAAEIWGLHRLVGPLSTATVVGSRNPEPYSSIVQSSMGRVSHHQLRLDVLARVVSHPLTHTSQSCTTTGFLTNSTHSFDSSLGRQIQPAQCAQLHLAKVSGRMQHSRTPPTGIKLYTCGG